MVIATKFGFVVDEHSKQVTRHVNNEEVIKHISSSCEVSLKRLGTDYIDLYQLGVWNYPAKRANEVLGILERLMEGRKIRSYGWSPNEPASARVFAHCETGRGKRCGNGVRRVEFPRNE